MISPRELFIKHVAQTSPFPLSLEIDRAEGCYINDTSGKQYLDMISGISVSNLGHCHPNVVQAVKQQADKYMHVMVYGEYIQSPQVQLAALLSSLLPSALQSVYFVNSGAEAIEGALKLAKRYTGRTELISFKNSYHGSTQGALSLMGDERLKQPFRPLLPDVRHLEFNNVEDLNFITTRTAAVVIEPIQAEAGVILPVEGFLQKLRERCTEMGTLLIFDEIQTGYGRTGKLFAFEHYNVTPDVLCLAKGMGGGMPLGAFISSQKIMSDLSTDPELGHITTFGGNPVCCAAGFATLQTIVTEKLVQDVEKKSGLIIDQLKHPLIRGIRSKGLLIAVEFENFELNKKIIDASIQKGVIVDWFLFNMKSMRLAPPLIISEDEISIACSTLLKCINTVRSYPL
ncbi:MAG: aspartate aminotransferase family protein [Bacteroidia bacterium]|nr:aspartate aminotransferase family protein [Bacteroidia bacterium]